jgi:AraC-like DNA-binding protein
MPTWAIEIEQDMTRMRKDWTPYEDRLRRVTDYIYDHLDDDLSLDTLAGVAALSPCYWHRVLDAQRKKSAPARSSPLAFAAR